MTDQLFYQMIAAIDADLSEDQHVRLDVFLAERAALEHYAEMVNPSEPNPNEAQRDQDAAMRAFCIFQCLTEEDWPVFYEILGDELRPRFDAGVEKVKERFKGLLG